MVKKYCYGWIFLMLCMISVLLSGCFFGNASIREAEVQLVDNKAVYEDELGVYQIAFYKVTYQNDANARGGTWYEKNGKSALFTFVFGPEAGTLLILCEGQHVASMDWRIDGQGVFVASGYRIHADSDLHEKLRSFADQTYVFHYLTVQTDDLRGSHNSKTYVFVDEMGAFERYGNDETDR